MAKICPLTHGACIGENCFGFTTRCEYSAADTPGEYLDTTAPHIIANNVTHIPMCKLFGDLPQEEAK